MGIHRQPRVRKLLLACFVAAASLVGGHVSTQSIVPPNILFIILDDVGKDQLTTFNPASPTGLLTPTLNAIAAGGVQFTSFYTMPECSPSRAAFFTGRYPFRTGVTAAILDLDLPAAHVSPFEVTTPRVLAPAGYTSAMFGKYHLGGPENNPDGNGAPVALGWDYFDGNLRGGPPPIDTTLGGSSLRTRPDIRAVSRPAPRQARPGSRTLAAKSGATTTRGPGTPDTTPSPWAASPHSMPRAIWRQAATTLRARGRTSPSPTATTSGRGPSSTRAGSRPRGLVNT